MTNIIPRIPSLVKGLNPTLDKILAEAERRKNQQPITEEIQPEKPLALGKPKSQVTPEDLPKLKEADNEALNLYQKRLTELEAKQKTPEFNPDEYHKLTKLREFRASRLSVLNDISQGKRTLQELPALSPQDFGEDQKITTQIRQKEKELKPPEIPMEEKPAGTKTGIDLLKPTETPLEMKYIPPTPTGAAKPKQAELRAVTPEEQKEFARQEAEEERIGYKEYQQYGTFWDDFKNVISKTAYLLPFGGAIPEDVAKQAASIPVGLLKGYSDMLLHPEIPEDRLMALIDIGTIVLPTKGAGVAQKLTAQEAKLYGLNLRSYLTELRKFYPEKTIRQLQDFAVNTSGKIPELAEKAQQTIARPMVDKGTSLEAGMARIRKGIPEGKPPIPEMPKELESLGQYKNADELKKMGNDIPEKYKNSIFKLETKSIDDLQQVDFYEPNYWKTEYAKDIIKSAKKGELNPIIIKEDGTILDGNRRLEAYKKIGKTEITVYTAQATGKVKPPSTIAPKGTEMLDLEDKIDLLMGRAEKAKGGLRLSPNELDKIIKNARNQIFRDTPEIRAELTSYQVASKPATPKVTSNMPPKGGEMLKPNPMELPPSPEAQRMIKKTDIGLKMGMRKREQMALEGLKAGEKPSLVSKLTQKYRDVNERTNQYFDEAKRIFHGESTDKLTDLETLRKTISKDNIMAQDKKILLDNINSRMRMVKNERNALINQLMAREAKTRRADYWLDKGQEVAGRPLSITERMEVSRLFDKKDMGGLVEAIRNLAPKITYDKVLDVLGIPKTIMASVDLSAPLRQGILFVGRSEFWKGLPDMIKAAISEKHYNLLMDEIKATETYPLKRAAGWITDTGTKLTPREEAIPSYLAEKIPGLGRLIKGSNRAYTSFLNKLRSDVFDSIYYAALDAGELKGNIFHHIKEGDKIKFIKDLQSFIGNATGRGNLGTFTESSKWLNSVFFSPRLMASRVQMLNPVMYARLSPMVRKEAIASMAKTGGIGLTTLSLAALMGADIETDPRSSDFGKIKIGNTRFDIWGGFQQYIVLGARLITGQIKYTSSERVAEMGKGTVPSRAGAIGRFLENKEAPIASYITAYFKGKGFGGKDFNATDEALSRVIPMMISDTYELYKEHGLIGLPMAIPGAFGVGSQTYGGRSDTSIGEDIADTFRPKEVVEEKTEGREIKKRVGEQTKQKYQLTDKAQKLYEELKPLTGSDRKRKLDEIELLRETNPKLYDKIADIQEEDKKGLKRIDKLIKQLQVKNGARARYIYNKSLEIKNLKKRDEWIDELDQKGIISKKVWEQIEMLMETKGEEYE